MSARRFFPVLTLPSRPFSHETAMIFCLSQARGRHSARPARPSCNTSRDRRCQPSSRTLPSRKCTNLTVWLDKQSSVRSRVPLLKGITLLPERADEQNALFRSSDLQQKDRVGALRGGCDSVSPKSTRKNPSEVRGLIQCGLSQPRVRGHQRRTFRQYSSYSAPNFLRNVGSS